MSPTEDEDKFAALVSQIVTHLEDVDSEKRLGAAEDLSRLSGINGDLVFSAVTPFLKHSRWEVRLAAVQALSGFLENGDPEAILLLIRSSADDHQEVRKACFCKIDTIPDSTDRQVITEISTLLTDKQWEVRLAALFALSRIAQKDDAETIALLAGRLEDPRPEVRRSAIKSLGTLVTTKYSPAALTSVVTHVSDSRKEVRESAFEILRELPCCQDDKDMASLSNAVCGCCENADWEVRFAAVYTLPKVALKGEQKAVALARKCLRDDQWQVRQASAEALIKIAKPGDAVATSGLAECLSDAHVKVRIRAAKALDELAKKGDPDTIRAVEAHLESEDWETRMCALRTLPKVATKGDERVITRMAKSFTDEKQAVRSEAVLALESLSSPGDSFTISIVEPYLHHESWRARLAAVWASWALAKTGYGSPAGTCVAIMSAVICSGSLVFLSREAQLEIPQRAEESSYILWLLCLFLRLVLFAMLVKLSVKGWKTPCGALIVLICGFAASSAMSQT
eukprot:TRINITY_DN99075_c0_g1_i1.p1 TRINITY_DN99075_c0_g1~~TRINITY_DN99075_c0_g1_i1.p1  ORF type:complete len:512 (+),score=85.04 TRINITY_DN99075_c0_g1_i1:24-1559(+)